MNIYMNKDEYSSPFHSRLGCGHIYHQDFQIIGTQDQINFYKMYVNR